MPTRKPVAKPFIASSVTPAPALPPPLVLPSEIRRSSLAQGGRSRSASSSPAPTRSVPKAPTPKPTPKPIYSPYSGLAVSPSSSSPDVSDTKNLPIAKPSTLSGAKAANSDPTPLSKSMTSASMPAFQSTQKSQPVHPSPLAREPMDSSSDKSSFGQKLKKAFSFGRKSSRTTRPSTPKQKSERTFSLSFMKKSHAFTMTSSSMQPNVSRKKESGRAMTMSTLDYADKRTSTMTSTSTMPTFEGFDASYEHKHHRKSTRSKHIDDDAASLRSNTSISSFATLKKMGSSFSKGTKNLFNKNQPKAASHVADAAIPSQSTPAPREPLRKSASSNPIAAKPVDKRPRSLSLVTPSTPSVALGSPEPFFASSVDTPSSATSSITVPPTPTRTDADSITTDAASTIKVSNNSLDDTLAVHLSESESDEDLNIADTVFPKSLDLITVENIRSSLDRAKSLERRRSRRSNRSSRSSKSVQREDANQTQEVHVTPEDAPFNEPGSSNSSTHGILKQPSPAEDFEEIDENSFEKPTITRSRNSLKPSPSISSIFDFGDDNINLDLNFDFASAAAADITTEAKKYKSSLKSKPKDYALTESHVPEAVQRSYQQADHHRTKSPSQAYYHPLYHRSTSSSGSVPAAGSTVSFSSRIIIFDTYDALDYDRRAEIATCNRLNPALAQQIKEELNNFKMEMDVHSDSRIYTHFY